MDDAMLSRLAIRELLDNWVVWRDAGDWDRFRTVWHADGRMMATWFQGSADEFIRVTIEGWNKGVSILHFLGGTSIDLAGDRAIAQTKMTISQRAKVHDVLCDVVCTGRFYDFLDRRGGRWGLVLRQPIYEKDRIDPVDARADTRGSRSRPRSSCRLAARPGSSLLARPSVQRNQRPPPAAPPVEAPFLTPSAAGDSGPGKRAVVE